mmetsp:Transcript_2877/g.6418  ORF Transcript_2877/g.6418 Transcript_2877/m.6418 type:complete len:89 (+) Transcript_2877:177-443(+)
MVDSGIDSEKLQKALGRARTKKDPCNKSACGLLRTQFLDPSVFSKPLHIKVTHVARFEGLPTNHVLRVLKCDSLSDHLSVLKQFCLCI